MCQRRLVARLYHICSKNRVTPTRTPRMWKCSPFAVMLDIYHGAAVWLSSCFLIWTTGFVCPLNDLWKSDRCCFLHSEMAINAIIKTDRLAQRSFPQWCAWMAVMKATCHKHQMPEQMMFFSPRKSSAPHRGSVWQRDWLVPDCRLPRSPVISSRRAEPLPSDWCSGRRDLIGPAQQHLKCHKCRHQ